MKTTYTRPVTKYCPYRKGEKDEGTLTITTNGPAPELHAFTEQVNEIAFGNAISHEDFTQEIAALAPPDSIVTTTWQTAGWQVQVTCTSP